MIDDNKILELNVFGFDVLIWNFGFKIFGDMINKGRFYFGFVYLCVNGKKEFSKMYIGFVMNWNNFD